MSDDQGERFKFVNYDDPSEHGKGPSITPANKINEYASNLSIMGIQGGLGWRQLEKNSSQNRRTKNAQPSEQQKQKDRKIRKLTNINKHLLQQLKLQNDQLSKRLEKHKFRVPKKSNPRQQNKNEQNSKQVEGTKRELENAYRQIEYYKETISALKAKEMPNADKEKLNEMTSKLKEKNDDIESVQQEIRTVKIIKQMQSKELYKINNDELTDVLKKLDQQIKNSKASIKQAKRTLIKRQQLEKKQHAYFIELQTLIKKKKQQSAENDAQEYTQGNKKTQTAPSDEISESQWKQLKDKLQTEKKKYQEYGKKLTYHNYMKSKQSKLLEQLELKYKQKQKTLDKLKSKLNEVNKLAKIVPKPQILERVDLKMSKLKDIISRQNTLQLESINKAKSRVQSQDVRQFKKWELQHAQRQNDNQQSQLKYHPKNQSDYEDSYRLRPQQYVQRGYGNGDVKA